MLMLIQMYVPKSIQNNVAIYRAIYPGVVDTSLKHANHEKKTAANTEVYFFLETKTINALP